MLAKEIMTNPVTTVKASTALKDLAKIFADHSISGAPVLDTKGKLIGIVSDGDILAKKGKRVSSLMTKRVISVGEDTPVEEIANLMTAHKIKRVPVLHGEKLVGIVSRGDIVRALAMGNHIALHTPIYDL
ncbi:MAG TPA: CBS domain-containing protein [Terriglobales bacterium]|jgi:CBS domain-containing protein|nr:CBS domain-containing protein [Terriglobales bacterium]